MSNGNAIAKAKRIEVDDENVNCNRNEIGKSKILREIENGIGTNP